ncbi:MAG: SIS domain-containing protein [Verrucomicrobiota bacterium]|nr:SIS domain-containing protein [Verrucomicrobiota bacterium]
MQKIEILINNYPELKDAKNSIINAYECILGSIKREGTLLLCGNGGSASDCEHWSGELLKGFVKNRSLSANEKQNLSKGLRESLQQGVPCIPLPSFISVQSAFSNDVLPEAAFAQLVWALGKNQDVLVGISTSGNSQNILFAIEAAKAKGMKTIGLTGKNGGKLAESTDIVIKAPSDETYRIQEYHLPIYHTICMMLEESLF